MKLKSLVLAFSIYLKAASCLGVSKWKRYNQGEFVGQACFYSETNTANYCLGSADMDSYTCQCDNEVSLGAYSICLFEKTPTDRLRKQGLAWLKMQCPNYSDGDINSAYENATRFVVNQTESYNADTISYVPIRYNETMYENALETFILRYEVFDDGMFFGMGLCGYFAVVVLLGTFYRAYKVSGLDRALQLSHRFKFLRTLKSKFVLSGVYGKLCKEDHWLGTIPNRLESLVILGWVLFNFFAVFFHYRSNGSRNVYWDSTYKQITRYVADRCGYIALFLMNLSWFFASRNNFLIWCTGWKHSTFITYHKWVGRACVFHVVLHSVFLWWQSALMNYLAARVLTGWYRWGCVATVACSIMTIQANSYFRKLSYEVFLIGHIILSTFFLIGSWKHLDYSTMAFWMLPIVAIWGFDKIMRLVRIFVFGGYVKADIQLNHADEILTVTIPHYNNKFFKFHPGQFAYLYFADMNSSWYYLWQSHPFTIVSSGNDTTIKFFIKAKRGITNSIMKNMIDRNVSQLSMKVAVEGPYGSINWGIKRTDYALLYSSSTGNAGPLMYAKQLLESNQNTKIKFYWGVQYSYSLDWFREELEYLSQHKNRVEVIVYLSKENLEKDLDISQEFKTSSDYLKPTTVEDYSHVNIRYGRFNAHEVVTKDIEECGSATRISVVTCGHPQMCDDVRAVVKQQVLNNYQVELFDDLQKW